MQRPTNPASAFPLSFTSSIYANDSYLHKLMTFRPAGLGNCFLHFLKKALPVSKAG
jgi:hypothetical protein